LPKNYFKGIKVLFSCALRVSFASYHSTGCEPPKDQLRIEAWRRNPSVLRFPIEKSREIKGLELPEITRSQWIVLDSSWNSQELALKERWKSLNKRERSLPAIGRSMTGGGEGLSVVEVTTSFPLLGAIRELKKCLNEEERRRRDLEFSENIKGSGAFSFSLIGFL